MHPDCIPEALGSAHVCPSPRGRIRRMPPNRSSPATPARCQVFPVDASGTTASYRQWCAGRAAHAPAPLLCPAPAGLPGLGGLGLIKMQAPRSSRA